MAKIDPLTLSRSHPFPNLGRVIIPFGAAGKPAGIRKPLKIKENICVYRISCLQN